MTEAPKSIGPGQASKMLGVTQATLKSWREKNIGPSFYTLPSGTARYPLAAVERVVADMHAAVERAAQ